MLAPTRGFLRAGNRCSKALERDGNGALGFLWKLKAWSPEEGCWDLNLSVDNESCAF